PRGALQPSWMLAVTLDLLQQEFGVGQNAGKRVVHFVCDDGGEFPNRSHSLHLEHLLTGPLQLMSFLGNTAFQSAIPVRYLEMGALQFLRHEVERRSQFANFIPGRDGNFTIEFSSCDPLGVQGELLDWPV